MWEALRWLLENPRTMEPHPPRQGQTPLRKEKEAREKATIQPQQDSPSFLSVTSSKQSLNSGTGCEGVGAGLPAAGGCPAPGGPLPEGTAVGVALSPPALPCPMAAVVKDSFLEEW